MTFGPDYFYKCPTCDAILKNRSIMSGNNFGATYFSDGECIAPMLPDYPNLTKCQKCDTILWLSDMKPLGDAHWGEEPPEWKEAHYVEHLEINDLYAALEKLENKKKTSKQKKREIFVRQRIWWAYNRKTFENLYEIVDWKSNLVHLLDLLDLDENNHRCIAAEIYRNLCNFPKCLEIINTLPEKFAHFKNTMLEECRKKNPLTVTLGNKEKRIEEEKHYDKDISTRLAEKIEQDEETAINAWNYYFEMAQKCHPEALYELGNMYNSINSGFYDSAKAAECYEYAALLGHKEAFSELEELGNYSEGDYDPFI